ncbi:hypothetical protein JFC73_21325 [Enterobacter hormaechei]|uniref:hypothetical protein n=1 Tax=Enterobacter hormaechei TaxID=158836 RepID=UPI0018E6A8C2|nr:hypothetical protein [Enterobacter hormaechei]HCM9628374.1 hypothetical protein [Enterobacter hormaechei subsp. steigerwaltii]MBI8975725.1 hypothetical protein [Enterobacter hormaechei]MBI8997116.1 hypothetical protein [Enterobacter hormaechei]MBI9025122.1 hypothetical protein [Enterobacter hormaechei]MBI9029613.1 hypothetical protein [Enterobacter hormaechei]
MSNIDKQSLRQTAEKAQEHGVFNMDIHSQTVLALLDELEAKDNRINRLEAIVAVAEQRNALMREWKRALKVPCDLVDDQVPVVIHGMVIRLERLKETEDKLTAAEKRIAEMQALARGVKQFSEFQICHYGATEDYAKGYIDCQNNYNKVLFAAADKGE